MAQSGSGSGGGGEEIEVPNGVYIQDTDGVLWQEAAWDGSATPNGVAVVADECRFVIALSESSIIPIDSNGYSSSIELTTYSQRSNAITDFSGPSNTQAMMGAYGNDRSEAAGYCAYFTFPNGLEGYLGSAGEWQVAYDNKSAIDACMSKAGGKAIGNSYYWSSTMALDYTEYDDEFNISNIANRFWHLRWSIGFWDYSNAYVYSGYVARPFTELGEVTGIVEA